MRYSRCRIGAAVLASRIDAELREQIVTHMTERGKTVQRQILIGFDSEVFA